MPTEISTLTLQGLQPVEYRAESLRQAAGLEPPGVYTVTRTYRADHVVLFDAHLDRLEESARLEGIEITLERQRLRSALRRMVARAEYGDCRLRVTIPAGAPDQPILAIEPLPPMPPEVKAQGVVTATIGLARRNPRAKSNAWEAERQRARNSLPEECYEGLLVDENGQLLEGFASNFYAIRNSSLQTAEQGILMGISRRILFEVLPAKISLERRPPRTDELGLIEEAFLTSSSRGVVPIVRIDDKTIGDGRPGGTTRELSQHYDRWVEDHLEPL